MTKKQLARQQECENVYFELNTQHNLQSLHVNAQVKFLVEAADSVLSTICKLADSIKIDAYETVKDEYSVLKLSKPTWLELVHLRRLQRHGVISDKVIENIKMSFAEGQHVSALRASYLDSVEQNTDEVSLPSYDESAEWLNPLEKDFDDPEFVKLLNESADTRHEIDADWWPKIHYYAMAFEHLTSRPYSQFKDLLDWHHYKHGGYPSDKTPPRLWSIMAKYRYAMELLSAYEMEYDQVWNNRLGIDMKLGPLHPTWHTFNEAGWTWGNFKMFKPTKALFDHPNWQTAVTTLKLSNVNDGTHCVIAKVEYNTYIVFYQWDTREIHSIVATYDLAEQLQNIHNNDELFGNFMTTSHIDDLMPLIANAQLYANHEKVFDAIDTLMS